MVLPTFEVQKSKAMSNQDRIKLRNKLGESLARQMRFASEEERTEMARFIETELPVFVRRHLDTGLESVWTCTSASQWQEWRTRIATVPGAKAENDASDGLFSKAIKYFAYFLNSRFYRDLQVKPKKVKDIASRPQQTTYVEGNVVQQTVDRRERDPQVRQACIDKYGCRCMVCGFDFKAVYGPVGEGYIEVHHLLPISQTNSEHEVNPDDLRPLCANCHAMAHRRRPEPFSIEELKQLIEDAARQA